MAKNKRTNNLIYVCSPYRGNVRSNTQWANIYCRKIWDEGNIPIAPHIYFPQWLDDTNKAERQTGVTLALSLLEIVKEVWVFGKHYTLGMQAEINQAIALKKTIKYYDKYGEILLKKEVYND